MLEIEAFAMFLSNKTSSLTFGLGAVAAVGLSVVAVVGANEFNPLHTSELFVISCVPYHRISLLAYL